MVFALQSDLLLVLQFRNVDNFGQLPTALQPRSHGVTVCGFVSAYGVNLKQKRSLDQSAWLEMSTHVCCSTNNLTTTTTLSQPRTVCCSQTVVLHGNISVLRDGPLILGHKLHRAISLDSVRREEYFTRKMNTESSFTCGTDGGTLLEVSVCTLSIRMESSTGTTCLVPSASRVLCNNEQIKFFSTVL